MPEPHPILLFDGTCGLCDRTVRLVARLDRRERFRFAPLQSEAAVYLFQHHDVPDSIESIVLVHAGTARVQSDAAIATARLLGFPWSLAVMFRIIPRPIRDAAYRFVARHRYRVFGRVEACSLPQAGLPDRVIETREQAEGVLGTATPGRGDR